MMNSSSIPLFGKEGKEKRADTRVRPYQILSPDYWLQSSQPNHQIPTTLFTFIKVVVLSMVISYVPDAIGFGQWK